jgi:multidrug resistance efflux pump
MNVRTTLPAVLAFALFGGCSKDDAKQKAAEANLFTVKREDLPITVKENAEMQALRETIVRSEVEGQSTIIWIVPEGTLVAQGDKLVELDVSEMVEKRATQAIAVTKAEAAFEQSKEEARILNKELTTKRGTAQSALKIAEMELEKFLGRPGKAGGVEGKNADMLKKLTELVSSAPTKTSAVDPNAPKDEEIEQIPQVDPRNFVGLVTRARDLLLIAEDQMAVDHSMGDMSNKVLAQVDVIRLAMSDLSLKEDTYRHSRRLAAKQFITRNELEKDRLAWQAQVSKVTLAWNDLDLLVNYTLGKERIKLGQDAANAKLELERVLAANSAAEFKAKSDTDSKKAELDLAKERLVNFDKQIKGAVINAPTPGLVVYAKIDRGRGGEAVREGVQVRERQDLIVLPDTTKMRCLLKVQEAQVDKLTRGQPAFVQPEAFPGEVFTGRVTSVAPVADSNSGWMTSDRKVYTTVVELDSDNQDARLRSRMAASVTIQVETIANVLPVPLQAVRRDRSVHYVWKQTKEGPVATVVEPGRNNSERVAITKGITEGDVIHIVPPQGMQEPKFEQPVMPVPAPLKDDAKGAAAAPGAGSGGPGAGAAANGPTGNGTGAGGPGGGRGGRGGMGSQKKIAEMTPEELTAYVERLDSMTGMAASAGEEQAAKFTDIIQKLKVAIEKKQLDEAQVHQDALRTMMRSMMGSRGGNRGGRGGSGGGPGGPGGSSEAGGAPRER